MSLSESYMSSGVYVIKGLKTGSDWQSPFSKCAGATSVLGNVTLKYSAKVDRCLQVGRVRDARTEHPRRPRDKDILQDAVMLDMK